MVAPHKLRKSALLALGLVVAFFIGWEWFCRQLGYEISFTDSVGLWADQRDRLNTEKEADVIIGSSRILFGINLKVWEEETGEKPVQLAMPGTNPVPLLGEIANHSDFRGKLYFGVTPSLFYAPPQAFNTLRATERLKKYHQYTPSQRFGHRVGTILEEKLVFVDENELGLQAWLDRLQDNVLPQRPGVMRIPPPFAEHFTISGRDRQVYITNRFMADTSLQNHQKRVWRFMAQLGAKQGPMPDSVRRGIIRSVAANVKKIQQRGGEVIFIRMPSSNELLMGENRGFPRALYWDSLLVACQSRGYYFEDYPELRNFKLPENSHLSPDDARIYTRHLLEIMRRPGAVPVPVIVKTQP